MLVREATLAEINGVRDLFREYAAWVNDKAICFQAFDQELAELPGAYSPPRGRLLVAVDNDTLAGSVALRPLEDGSAEMKRLYLREDYRGQGLGAKLVHAAISEARAAGYRLLRLDTLPKMQTAQKLYESLGFRNIARYNTTPGNDVRFLELDLLQNPNPTRNNA